MGPTGVIDAIAETITRYKRLPVYVAEGTSIGKLAHIYSLPYLRHCYEKLCSSSGPFFVYIKMTDISTMPCFVQT